MDFKNLLFFVSIDYLVIFITKKHPKGASLVLIYHIPL